LENSSVKKENAVKIKILEKELEEIKS